MGNSLFSSIKQTLFCWREAMISGNPELLAGQISASSRILPGYWLLNLNQGFDINCFCRLICFFQGQDSAPLLLCENINGNFCTLENKFLLCLQPSHNLDNPRTANLSWAINALTRHQIVTQLSDPPTLDDPHAIYDPTTRSWLAFYLDDLAPLKEPVTSDNM